MPPGEAAHFVSVAPIVAARRSRAKAVTSHLLPTFARVDLAFERESGWVVVDYKTDREIAAAGEEQYRRQIAIYAAAIAQATGKPAEGILVSLT